MKITRNVKPGGVSEIGVLSLSVAAVMSLVPASCVLELTPSGIAVRSTTPARLQNRPGDAAAGAPVVDGGIRSPALWLRFDEGLFSQDDFTRENVKGSKCAIRGADSYWRRGVSGTCLSFDGFVIRNWGGQAPARLKIDGRAQIPGPDYRQGLIRDTDSTETMIIWVRQRSSRPLHLEID